MNAIVAQNFGPVSNRFQGQAANNDLASGVQASFGHIGYKGKVWSIRYRGEEQKIMREDGDGPRNSIEVVILKSSAAVSKIYYEGQFVEGSTAAPDCWSTDGKFPDAAATKKQATSCALCPKNQWGSRVTNAGKQGKACADSKRLAVVPAGDLNNEVYGGPMLLRVPAGSLQALAHYGNSMAGMGYPYFAVVTQIKFDASVAHPSFQFSPVRPLTDEEAEMVVHHQNGAAVGHILAEEVEAPPSPMTSPTAPAWVGTVSSTVNTSQNTTGMTTANAVPTAAQPTSLTPSHGTPAASNGSSSGNTNVVKTGGFGAVQPAGSSSPGNSQPSTIQKVSTGFGATAAMPHAVATRTETAPALNATAAYQLGAGGPGTAGSITPKHGSETEPTSITEPPVKMGSTELDAMLDTILKPRT